MIKIADLKLKVIADLKKLKQDIKDVTKEKLNIGVKEKGAGAGSTIGVLGKILKVLGPIAILLSLKPIADILSLLLNFTIFYLIKIFKALTFSVTGAIQGMRDDLKSTTFFQTVVGAIDKLKDTLALKGQVELIAEIAELKEILKQNGIDVINGQQLSSKEIRKILESNGVDASTFSDALLQTLVDGNAETVSELVALKGGVTQIGGDIVSEIDKSIIGNKSDADNIAKEIKEGATKTGEELTKNTFRLIALDALVTSTKGGILGAISGIPKLVAKLILGRLSGLLGRFKRARVGDAIIKPDGSIIETDPRDTLIATKTPELLGGGSKTFNFYGVTSREMTDILKREIAIPSLRSSRF